MEIKKIATHNSATGEKGKGVLSLLVTPFAKCQSKTIKEQYDAGCRMFDIRIIKRSNSYHCAHGIWTSRKTAKEILSEINDFGTRCYVSITYEGKLKLDKEKSDLFVFIDEVKSLYQNIKWGPIAVKYADTGLSVDWVTIASAQEWYKNEQAFLPLNGSTWHTYFPLPWLWKKIYYNKPTFNTEIFRYVDFL